MMRFAGVGAMRSRVVILVWLLGWFWDRRSGRRRKYRREPFMAESQPEKQPHILRYKREAIGRDRFLASDKSEVRPNNPKICVPCARGGRYISIPPVRSNARSASM